jgi:hypothetical protein
MKPQFVNSNVRACCPDCKGAVTTYEWTYEGRDLGSVILNEDHEFNGKRYSRIIYHLMRCAGCGRGGLAKVHCSESFGGGELESFFPFSIEHLSVPNEVPEDIKAEFREAELCVAFGATRAASALFRSSLEKTLKANGYDKGTLKDKINEATQDGVITEARKRRANENIRVLGNDVLHEEWREINADEVSDSHRYAQRIVEDFYDDRKSVENILVQKKRIAITS